MNTQKIAGNLENVFEEQYADVTKISDFFTNQVEAIQNKVASLIENIRLKMVEDMEYMEKGMEKIMDITNEMKVLIKNEEMKIHRIIEKNNSQNELDILMQKLYI